MPANCWIFEAVATVSPGYGFTLDCGCASEKRPAIGCLQLTVASKGVLQLRVGAEEKPAPRNDSCRKRGRDVVQHDEVESATKRSYRRGKERVEPQPGFKRARAVGNSA